MKLGKAPQRAVDPPLMVLPGAAWRVGDSARIAQRLRAYELALVRRRENEGDAAIEQRADRIFAWAAGEAAGEP